MPNNVVESPRDEYKWKRAEQIAAKSGHKGDYAYVMGIYKRMKPDHKFKKASINEPDWFQIVGDIISYSSWDSEKTASSFADELDRISEGIEKKSSVRTGGALARTRAAQSLVSLVDDLSRTGRGNLPAGTTDDAIRAAYARVGKKPPATLPRVERLPPQRAPSRGPSGKRTKNIPATRPTVASRVPTDEAPRRVIRRRGGQQTQQTRPDLPTGLPTGRIRGGEGVSGSTGLTEAQKQVANRPRRRAFTVKYKPQQAATQLRGGASSSAENIAKQQGKAKAVAESAKDTGFTISRTGDPSRQLPGPVGRDVAPLPKGYREAYQKALDSGVRPEQIMNPTQWARAQAGRVKPTGRGAAPAATTTRMERMATKSDLITGRARGRTDPRTGKFIGGVKKPGYTDAQRSAARDHVTAKKALKSEQARLAEMQAAPTVFGERAIAQQAAKVEKATAAVGTTKSQMRTATQARDAASVAQGAEGVAARDVKRRAAVGTERARLKREVSQGRMTGPEAEQAMGRVQNQATVGGQRDAARNVSSAKPKTEAPKAEAKPKAETQAPPAAEPGAADAGKRSFWDRMLGRNKPAQGSPPPGGQPPPTNQPLPGGQPPPTNQPQFSPGMQSQLDAAASQPAAGGFWSGLQQQWSQLTPNQKMLVGGAGVGAGAFMAGRSTAPQQPPVMQPPMQTISYPPQPMYRQPPTARAPRMVSYQ